MSLERHVKLFRNGRNQAVRIPREFELPGEDAIIRKERDRLIIEVAPPGAIAAQRDGGAASKLNPGEV
jgi:antitoxin VapB